MTMSDLKSPIWTTRKGTIMRMSDMTDLHLETVIKMLERLMAGLPKETADDQELLRIRMTKIIELREEKRRRDAVEILTS